MIAAQQIDPVLHAPPIGGLIVACRSVVAAQVDHLNRLDAAIGDGDHGTNLLRGLDALVAARDRLALMTFDEAVAAAGTILVMTIGGASGPLYGTLLIELGRGLAHGGSRADFPHVFEQAVAAVARRGRTEVGDKTLLDVLAPLGDLLRTQGSACGLPRAVEAMAASTAPMQARRGRASFLGVRSVGHRDPGAASCALLVCAVHACVERGTA